jgi:hypothetical protein
MNHMHVTQNAEKYEGYSKENNTSIAKIRQQTKMHQQRLLTVVLSDIPACLALHCPTGRISLTKQSAYYNETTVLNYWS